MSVRRSLIVLLLVMVLVPSAVFLTTARNTRAEREQQLETLANLQRYTVNTGAVEAIVSAIGKIQADQTVQLSFLTAGRVDEVLVSAGDYVFAGDALVRLDSEIQRIAYEQALLALDNARLQLADAQSPPTEDELAIAQSAVDSAWGAYLSVQNAVTDEDIRAAELSYQQAYGAYEGLKAARDQAPGGFGSAAYNQLDAQTGAASFQAEIARLRLEQLRGSTAPQANATYARVLQAQKELERLQAGPTQFEIDSAQLAVDRAQSQVTRAETALNRTILTTPLEGVVSQVTAEVGGIATPGLTLVEVTDITPLRLTVQVDEVDIRLIREGMPATVELDALQEVILPAVIEKIALSGQPVNGIVNYDVTFMIEVDDPRVRVGMTAEANIVIERRDDVITLPNVYIRRDGERAFVNVLKPDNSIEEIEITLGLQGRDSSEVLTGLQTGDVAVINFADDRFSIFGG